MFYQMPVELRKKDILIEAFNYGMDVADQYVSVKEYENDLDSGRNALAAYWEKYGQDEELLAAETELEFNVPLTKGDKPINFTGYVDFLFGGNEPPAIMELKTGASADIENFVSYNLQAPRYIWALGRIGISVRDVLSFR